jgi:hypothetical protein
MASMIGREGEPIVHDARRVFNESHCAAVRGTGLSHPISPILPDMIRFDLDIMMAKCAEPGLTPTRFQIERAPENRPFSKGIRITATRCTGFKSQRRRQ